MIKFLLLKLTVVALWRKDERKQQWKNRGPVRNTEKA